MSAYEALSRQYLGIKTSAAASQSSSISSIEAGVVGFVSGALTAVFTSPMDCVNTRIKSGELKNLNLIAAHAHIIKIEGVRALFKGIVPRVLITGFGSTMFWFLYSQLAEQAKNF